VLRDLRGSATTEGVIVAIFLAMIFGAAIWSARLFVRGLVLGRDVRAQIDGPSFLGATGGVEDSTRIGWYGSARGLSDRWVPLRTSELATLEDDRVRADRRVNVDRPAPVGGGSEELRWQASRLKNEIPRAGPEGNWPAMLDTWGRTGMRGR
jgi:hypothetical protein